MNQYNVVERTTKMHTIWIIDEEWRKYIMLIPTDIIFLVVITNGTICCLNSFIILYMKICPKNAKLAMANKCMANKGCDHENSMKGMRFPVRKQQTRESAPHHLLISTIIIVGYGLNFSLISAWKSGRNPSAKSDTTNRTSPNISTFLSSPCLASGSNTLNSIIPVVTAKAAIIFFPSNLSALVLTLEQITPTKMTERMLQDLNMMTMGQLTMMMAQLLVTEERKMKNAHRMLFLGGILVCIVDAGMKMRLQHTPNRKITIFSNAINPYTLVKQLSS